MIYIKNKKIAFTLLFVVVLVSLSKAQPTPKRVLLAISKANHTMAIVDPGSLKILSKIPVGQDPHEVIASTDGTRAYVCIYGGGSFHEINEIDLIERMPIQNIDTRPLYGPHDITFLNDKAWFTAEGSKAIGRLDTKSGKLDWSMGTGQERTHMLYVSTDEKKICTINIASGTVSIFDKKIIMPGNIASPNAKPREEWSQTLVPVSRGSEGFDVFANGNELWTASGEDGAISIVDLVNNKFISKIDAKVLGANRLKFTPDGKLAFVSSLRTGDLAIFETQSHKEIKRIDLGKGAAGILMDPVGNRVFVACSADNNIAIIDLKTLEIIGRLDVGGVPDGLAWAIRP